MKYIRTNGGIIRSSRVELKEDGGAVIHDGSKSWEVDSFPIIKQADTIEELIDELVIHNPNIDTKYCPQWFIFQNKWEDILNEEYAKFNLTHYEKEVEVFGAIWTDKGLIYVAKMNEKGEIELL